VVTEVLVQAFVGVDAEELADAFDGQDIAVGQGGLGAALAVIPASVVDEDRHRVRPSSEGCGRR
jgi:hypothetical protein